MRSNGRLRKWCHHRNRSWCRHWCHGRWSYLHWLWMLRSRHIMSMSHTSWRRHGNRRRLIRWRRMWRNGRWSRKMNRMDSHRRWRSLLLRADHEWTTRRMLNVLLLLPLRLTVIPSSLKRFGRIKKSDYLTWVLFLFRFLTGVPPFFCWASAACCSIRICFSCISIIWRTRSRSAA